MLDRLQAEPKYTILSSTQSEKLIAQPITSNTMKSKIILLIAGVAAVTLSFTFASTSHSSKKEVTATRVTDEPAGGLALEDEK